MGETEQQQLGKKMKEIMDKSSATGVNSEFKTETLDKRSLIQRLNNNAAERIREKRPDVNIWRLRKILPPEATGESNSA